MARRTRKRNAERAKTPPHRTADRPVRVTQAAVVEPVPRPGDEGPLLSPAIEQWLRQYGATLGICLFLVVATLAVFGRTAGFEFVAYDDDQYVYKNHHVKEGLTLDGASWAFTHTYAGHWHPLTMLSHMLDASVYGMWAGGHHLTNLLLHAAGSVVLFLALRRMTGAVWRSGLVAALFCLHPLHVESVAWVSARKDVLSGLFFGLTLWAYAQFSVFSFQFSERKRGGFPWGWYSLVVVFDALGLMSKSMLVTMPFLLLLLDYWPLGRWRGGKGEREEAGRSWGYLILEKLPLMALSAASCAAAYIAQLHAGAVIENAPLGLRLQTVVLAYVGYLRKMFWPTKLAAPYPMWSGPEVAACVVGCTVLVGISAAVILLARRGVRYPLVGWFWYLGMLVPVSGIVVTGNASMADRYTYLTLTGVFIALTWAAHDVLGKSLRGWSFALGGAVLGICAAMSFVQAGSWENSGALWQNAIAATERNATALNGVAKDLRDHQPDRRNEALDLWRAALEASPNDYLANNNFGIALSLSGSKDVAIEYFRRAVHSHPEMAEGHVNLGSALDDLGRKAEAEQEFREAVRLDSENANAENNLGFLLGREGRWKDALPYLRRAVEIAPDNAQFHLNLGMALAALGEVPESIEEYKAALKIEPDNAKFHHEMAKMYHSLGKLQEAFDEWKEVLTREPGNAAAAKGMGMVLVKGGHGADAIPYLKTALVSAPGDIEARQHLVFAYLTAKQIPEAMGEYRTILHQNPKDRFVLEALKHNLAASPDNLFFREFYAYALVAARQTTDAMSEFREMLRQDQKNLTALNSLAWIEATNPDAKLRNGKEAVEFAEKAAAARKDDARTLDTLAAAYAEAGDFTKAVETARKAKKAAASGKDKGLSEEIQARLKLYETGKAYREEGS